MAQQVAPQLWISSALIRGCRCIASHVWSVRAWRMCGTCQGADNWIGSSSRMEANDVASEGCWVCVSCLAAWVMAFRECSSRMRLPSAICSLCLRGPCCNCFTHMSFSWVGEERWSEGKSRSVVRRPVAIVRWPACQLVGPIAVHSSVHRSTTACGEVVTQHAASFASSVARRLTALQLDHRHRRHRLCCSFRPHRLHCYVRHHMIRTVTSRYHMRLLRRRLRSCMSQPCHYVHRLLRCLCCHVRRHRLRRCHMRRLLRTGRVGFADSGTRALLWEAYFCDV